MLEKTVKTIETYMMRFLPCKKEKEILTGITADREKVICGYDTHWQEFYLDRDMLMISSSSNRKDVYCGISDLGFDDVLKIIETFEKKHIPQRDGELVELKTIGERVRFTFNTGRCVYACFRDGEFCLEDKDLCLILPNGAFCQRKLRAF